MKINNQYSNQLINILDLITIADVYSINVKYNLELDIFDIYDSLKTIKDSLEEGIFNINLEDKSFKNLKIFIGEQCIEDTEYILRAHNMNTGKEELDMYDTALYDLYMSVPN